MSVEIIRNRQMREKDEYYSFTYIIHPNSLPPSFSHFHSFFVLASQNISKYVCSFLRVNERAFGDSHTSSSYTMFQSKIIILSYVHKL
jgi:hypothetical protein